MKSPVEAILSHIWHAPGGRVGGVHIEATLEAPFGLLVTVRSLPVEAFDPGYLASGIARGVNQFSPLGAQLWSCLGAAGEAALDAMDDPPGDLVAVYLAPSAIERARTRFLALRAA